MPGPEAVVERVKGAGLRPWLEGRGTAEELAGFLRETGRAIARLYPSRADGRVLFPFLRWFVIAYR